MPEFNVNIKENRIFEEILQDQHRFQVSMGGAGSGKSYSAAQKIVYEIFFNTEKTGYLVVRKVAKTLRNSCFALLREIISDWGLTDLAYIRTGDMYIQSKWNGNDIILAGLDDVEKLKSITGRTKAWAEETSELDEKDLIQLNLRLRGDEHIKKQVIITFNPVSDQHWLKAHFYDNPKPNARIWHTTYKDNLYIDSEYREELEGLRAIDQYFYDVYCLGQWGALSDAIFSNYVIEDFKYAEKDMDSVHIGLDFGFNHYTVLVIMGFKDGELYILDEYAAKGKTNTEIIADINELDVNRRLTIRADSAEPDRIMEFRKAKYRMKGAEKGKDSVRHGIDYLKRFRVHIHKGKCPVTARQWALYKWRKDKDGNTIDEPVPLEDDSVAAIRYATEAIWKHYIPDIRTEKFSTSRRRRSGDPMRPDTRKKSAKGTQSEDTGGLPDEKPDYLP